jgi:hypothetical protein
MPKFETFTTEQGFFELAVAAPSQSFGTESVLPKIKNVPRRAKKKAGVKDRDQRKKLAEALKELDESHRRRLAALQEELRGVQTQIREVSRTWKDRRKQFTSSRPKARR